MGTSKLEQLIGHLENYLECWKQFNHYLNMARAKKYELGDEAEFLEVKSVIAQELEVIIASLEGGFPSKEEVHTLLSNAPSIRYLSELNEGTLRGIENQWHKAFISWQSLLGQLKVQQKQYQSRSIFSRLFS